MPDANANPRLSVGYALANSATPQTYAAAQQAQMLAQQLQDTTSAGQNPVGIGSALANGLAAYVQKKKLEGLDSSLMQQGQQGQQATYNTAAANIGMGPGSAPPGATPSPQAIGAALTGQPAPQAGPAMATPSDGAMPASAPPPPPPATPQGGSGAAPGPMMSQPTPGPMASGQGPSGQGPPQGFPGAAGAAGSPRVGPPITPQDRDALIRMVYGEARGEHPAGQAATAAVALNRSILSGQPVAQVVTAPGQFEGMRVGAQLNPGSPDYQRIASVVDPLLTGNLPDPSGGATHFYAPAAQAALGRAPPAWDDGSGRMIGNQKFFNKPYGGQSTMPPGSYQVAQNGPLGPMPSSAAAQLPGGSGAGSAPPQDGPGGAPAPAQGGPGAPPAPPQMAYGNGPTQQERQTIQSYMASPNPQLRQQALEMMQSISTRMRTPIEYSPQFDANTGRTVYVPKTPGQGPVQYAGAPAGYEPPAPASMMWGPDGQVHAMPGTQVSAPQRVSPGATSQQDPFGKVTYNAVPGLAGEAPAGTAWNGHAYAPVPGAQVTQQGGFAPGSVVQRAPNGSATVVQQPQFGATDAAGLMKDLSTNPATEKMRKTGEMYRNLVSSVQRPGGVSDAELTDYVAQIVSGGVARQFNQKMLDEAQGPLAQLKQIAPQILSGQHYTPQARLQMLQVAHDAATEANQGFQQEAASRQAIAKANGQDLTPFLAPYQNDLPTIPSLASIPNGGGGVQNGNGSGNMVGGPAGGQPGGGMAGAGGRLTPQQAAGLNPGTRFQGLDGVWRVRH